MYEELKAKYNPEGSPLRKYQHHLLKVLIEFDAFCKDNSIDYSLAYGTLLGAVRHKGFIPWDDDADILMTRENADKLLALSQGKNHMITNNVGIAMGIRPELWMAPYAYIDIFILDEAPHNELIRRLKQLGSSILYCIMKCRGRINTKKIRPFKSWLIFLPISIFATYEGWRTIWRKWSMWKNGDAQNTEVQTYNDIPKAMHRRFKKAWIENYVQLDFEGHFFPAFAHYNEMLKECYGDYMQLPKDLHVHGFVNNIPINETTNDTKA